MTDPDHPMSTVHDFAHASAQIGLARGFAPLDLGLALFGAALKLIVPIWGRQVTLNALRQSLQSTADDGRPIQ